MKDESQQQVPPGIVAFKNKRTGAIFDYDDTEEFYKQWCEYRMEEPDNTIHTISVDGKEYSVGDMITWGSRKFNHEINSFEWKPDTGLWQMWIDKAAHISCYSDDPDISKLPPATEKDIVRDEDDRYYTESELKEGHRLMKSQPLHPVGKEEDGKLKAVGNAISALIAADKRIYELESELAALKLSKPEPSEEEMRFGYEKWLKGNEWQNRYQVWQNAIQWLSTYKQTKL